MLQLSPSPETVNPCWPQVAVQFLEVHHEEVRDLLGDPSPGGTLAARPAGGLPLRDSAVGGATASGLATRRVETAEDALALLRHGAAVRATGDWRAC